MSPLGDDKAWPMLVSTLERIESKQDRLGQTLQELRTETQGEFICMNQKLSEINGQVKRNTDFRASHSADHGLLRASKPDPEVAPTYMIAKRNPVRTILYALLSSTLLVSIIHPTPRAWVAKNFWSILKAMGAL